MHAAFARAAAENEFATSDARPDALGLSAEVALGGFGRERATVDTRVTGLGLRGLVLADGLDAVAEGTMAWVDVTLPTGAHIRPLVQLGAGRAGRRPARFRHLLPAHRVALEAFQASQATASGY